MRKRWVIAVFALFACVGPAVAQSEKPAGHRSTSQILDFFAAYQEKTLVSLAEAMPADKYTFAPAEGEFKGVRTFAQQLKHVAAANFILGAGILGENPPVDAGDETGPDSLRTKADVINYVKDSFAYLHKAVATIDEKNALVQTPGISPLPKGTATRLGLAVEALLHTWDHYGQLVEYLRMNNIVPPASRY